MVEEKESFSSKNPESDPDNFIAVQSTCDGSGELESIGTSHISREEAVEYRNDLSEYLTREQIKTFIDEAAENQHNTWIHGALELLTMYQTIFKVLSDNNFISKEDHGKLLDIMLPLINKIQLRKSENVGFEVVDDDKKVITEEGIVDGLVELAQGIYEASQEATK